MWPGCEILAGLSILALDGTVSLRRLLEPGEKDGISAYSAEEERCSLLSIPTGFISHYERKRDRGRVGRKERDRKREKRWKE